MTSLIARGASNQLHATASVSFGKVRLTVLQVFSPNVRDRKAFIQ